MRYLLIVGCTFLMLGCSTIYKKPGATDAEFERDHNDCLVKAGQAGYLGGDLPSNIRRNKFINQCLVGQGWVKQ